MEFTLTLPRDASKAEVEATAAKRWDGLLQSAIEYSDNEQTAAIDTTSPSTQVATGATITFPKLAFEVGEELYPSCPNEGNAIRIRSFDASSALYKLELVEHTTEKTFHYDDKTEQELVDIHYKALRFEYLEQRLRHKKNRGGAPKKATDVQTREKMGRGLDDFTGKFDDNHDWRPITHKVDVLDKKIAGGKNNAKEAQEQLYGLLKQIQHFAFWGKPFPTISSKKAQDGDNDVEVLATPVNPSNLKEIIDVDNIEIIDVDIIEVLAAPVNSNKLREIIDVDNMENVEIVDVDNF